LPLKQTVEGSNPPAPTTCDKKSSKTNNSRVHT
jgi:hypothetical protein